MKKVLIAIGIIVGIIVILVGTFISSYNGLVSMEEEVDGKLADISVQLLLASSTIGLTAS